MVDGEGTTSNPTLFQLFIPFEPVTPRTGMDTTKRKAKLREKLKSLLTDEELRDAREKLKGRVVKLIVDFRLWRVPPTLSDTRWMKDIDNLLKILFDVLGTGGQGLRLVEEDSYICEVHAKKSLVAEEENEGYFVKINEHVDNQMLRSLNESFDKRKTVQKHHQRTVVRSQTG